MKLNYDLEEATWSEKLLEKLTSPFHRTKTVRPIFEVVELRKQVKDLSVKVALLEDCIKGFKLGHDTLESGINLLRAEFNGLVNRLADLARRVNRLEVKLQSGSD